MFPKSMMCSLQETQECAKPRATGSTHRAKERTQARPRRRSTERPGNGILLRRAGCRLRSPARQPREERHDVLRLEVFGVIVEVEVADLFTKAGLIQRLL